MDAAELTLWLGAWGYMGLFALLLATGIGSPVPEDLLLATAGYLVAVGVLDWPLTCLIAGSGVIASDFLVYLAGRRIAWRSERHPGGRLLSAERLRTAVRWFDRFGDRVVVLARLVPGTRALVFMTAGMKPVPLKNFLLLDAVGAVIWVPLVLTLGYYLEQRFGDVSRMLASLQQAGAVVVIAVCALLTLWLTLGREESKL